MLGDIIEIGFAGIGTFLIVRFFVGAEQQITDAILTFLN